MVNTKDTINTLKEKYGISVPETPRFDVHARFKMGYHDALEGIALTYTDKETGTKISFITQTGYKDGEHYCTFRSQRNLNHKDILRELQDKSWQFNFSEKALPVYHGSEGPLDVPMDNSSDENEFIALFHRVSPLIRVALKDVDRNYEEYTEYLSVSWDLCILLAIDRAMDEYQELLKEELSD